MGRVCNDDGVGSSEAVKEHDAARRARASRAERILETVSAEAVSVGFFVPTDWDYVASAAGAS